MDLKQLNPTQLAVGAGLLVLLLVLLLLLLLLGRSRGKAKRRRRDRTEAALTDPPTAGLAAPPTEPTPTQPPAFPAPPGPRPPGPAPGSDPGAIRPREPGDAGLTLFGSTPQSRGPYRVVQSPGDPNQPRTPEPYPNDRLAAEQQRHRYPTPPQPRTAIEPTFDQPDHPRPSFAPEREPARDMTDPPAEQGRDDSPGDHPTDHEPAAEQAAAAPPAAAPEPTSTPAHPVDLPPGHPERNGLAAVPEPPVDGEHANGSAGDAKDRLLRVLLADPDRALHAVGDLEASRNQLDRLNDSVHYQRRQLADAARRLRGAGLTPAQVAQLAGFGEGELVTLLTEHTPSPNPRTPTSPPLPNL
ncbi:MAG TPA: hypothetical protein VH141_15970 [Pseudonocardia sp.]|jgi:hypothetical protein|nr:hypothetical protein [Pseudonocardia sp.]